MNIDNTVEARTAAAGSDARRRDQFDAALNLCLRKTRGNIKRLADEPKSAAWAVDGNYFAFKEGFYEIGNWTPSFFTGMALLAFTDASCGVQKYGQGGKNGYTSWGDYYLMEALDRELRRRPTWW